MASYQAEKYKMQKEKKQNKFSTLLELYVKIALMLLKQEWNCWPRVILLKPCWNYFSLVHYYFLFAVPDIVTFLCVQDREDCYFEDQQILLEYPLPTVMNSPRTLESLAILVFYGSHDFFCQNSAPWMLLRNVGIKTIWMATTEKTWSNFV